MGNSTEKKGEGGQSKTKAALYMVLAALAFSLTAAAVKILPDDIPAEQKLLSRSFVAILVTGLLISIRRDSTFRTKNPKLLAVRSVLGLSAMFCYFTAIVGLPLSEAVTLNHLSPFFVALFAALFLGERLVKFQVVAIITAFLGTLLVLRPGLISFTQYALLGLLSAVLAGGAYATLRALRKFDSPQTIVFWFSLVMFVVAFPMTISRGRLPSFEEFVILGALGVGGVVGQLSVTAAYRYAPGGEVAIYNYLGVAFSMLWQVGFFEDSLSVLPTIGAIVIVGGAYLNWRSKSGSDFKRG